MRRRAFLSTASSIGIASFVPATVPASTADEQQTDGMAVTAGSAPGQVLAGPAVVSGPAPEAISILQPVERHATGYLEYSIGNGDWQRVDAAHAGLLPLEQFVLKFRLPPLPPGADVRYRVTVHSVGWVQVREFVHGEIIQGPIEVGPEQTFRTLDPSAESTSFVVWNDTHENIETLRALHRQTSELKPDFLLWNGDQSNDLHFEKDMAGQFLSPGGLAIAEHWPLAYVRGNHDVRGPEARRLSQFTGTPGDGYYYAFRSGPLAALVMDTGEDKPDDSRYFGGLARFQKMQAEQAEWLKQIVKEPWFQEAPFKVLFCHIPLWWVRDIFPEHQRWEFHPICRELWLPTLVEAGVKLVVSGHTHDFRWLPAKDDQPMGQLVGGGPQPKYATFIHGTATQGSLNLKMSKLDGTVVAEVALRK